MLGCKEEIRYLNGEKKRRERRLDKIGIEVDMHCALRCYDLQQLAFNL